MTDVNEEFFDIANNLVSDEANSLLDRQLNRVLQWRDKRAQNGETTTLHDLITQVMTEPNKRGPVLAAYAAAMWRMLEQEGKL